MNRAVTPLNLEFESDIIRPIKSSPNRITIGFCNFVGNQATNERFILTQVLAESLTLTSVSESLSD